MKICKVVFLLILLCVSNREHPSKSLKEKLKRIKKYFSEKTRRILKNKIRMKKREKEKMIKLTLRLSKLSTKEIMRRLNPAMMKAKITPASLVTALTPQVNNPNVEVNTFGDLQSADTKHPPVVDEIADKFTGGGGLPFI